MRRIGRSAIIYTVMAVAIPATATGARAADPAEVTCPVGSVCFWKDPEFQGQKSEVAPLPGCNTVPGDSARSAMNVTSAFVLTFAESECGAGRAAVAFPMAGVPDLGMDARSFYYLGIG